MRLSLCVVLVAFAPQIAFANPSHGDLEITEHHIQVPHDTVPRFGNVVDAGLPITVNQRSGNFSDPSIWAGNAVPGSDARVQIAPDTVVTYDLDRETKLSCIEVEDHGHLKFATDRRTKLVLDELLIMPMGELTIGSDLQPIGDEVSAEVVFRGDTPLKTGTVESPGIDPHQYGKGLLVFGRVTMHGRALEQTFVRFAKEPLAGEGTLELEASPIGWRVGDRLIIPDTRQQPFTKDHTFTSQAEEVFIESIDKTSITLTAPLAFDHRGPRNSDGDVGPIERAMLPHVGNLTRNVIIRSENADDASRRGHTIYFHRADVDLRYAVFQDLGRTSTESLDNAAIEVDGNLTKIGGNQVGRYSIHLHHVWGPENPNNEGYQSHVVGNVLNGMLKWGMTLHDTHYGLIQGSIAYSGISTTPVSTPFTKAEIPTKALF